MPRVKLTQSFLQEVTRPSSGTDRYMDPEVLNLAAYVGAATCPVLSAGVPMPTEHRNAASN